MCKVHNVRLAFPQKTHSRKKTRVTCSRGKGCNGWTMAAPRGHRLVSVGVRGGGETQMRGGEEDDMHTSISPSWAKRIWKHCMFTQRATSRISGFHIFGYRYHTPPGLTCKCLCSTASWWRRRTPVKQRFFSRQLVWIPLWSPAIPFLSMVQLGKQTWPS